MSENFKFGAMALVLFTEGCGLIGDGRGSEGLFALLFAILSASVAPTPASRMEARHG